MEPTTIFATLTGAISFLFGLLVRELSNSRNTFQGFYLDEKRDHKETIRKASEVALQNAKSIGEMTTMLSQIGQQLNELPRRRDDWVQRQPDRSR